MFYHLFYPLKEFFSGLNIFKYLTFRGAGAAVTAFLIALLISPPVIRKLKKMKVVDNSHREYCPKLNSLHEKKNGTPTMGGIIIISAVLISTLLWSDLANSYVWLLVLALVWMGGLGFVDDYMKLKNRSNESLSIKTKLLAQIGFGVIVGSYLYLCPHHRSSGGALTFPFLKDLSLNLGLWYIPFSVAVIVSTSNAVNVTDGLDGLAIGCLIIGAGAYSIVSYLTGHIQFAHYLQIPYVSGAGELAVGGAALMGAGLAFLWFNAHPAQVFMGDIGSNALGAALGTVALITKHELLLFLVGGVFVVEIFSVLLQIVSFKLRGKRVFLRAPLHHHFELRGWQESQVIVRFWIIAIIFAIISLSTLKIR